jgi:hypothetical protein
MAKLQLALTALLLSSCGSNPAPPAADGGSREQQSNAGSGGSSGMTWPNREPEGGAGGGGAGSRQAGAGGRDVGGASGVMGRAAGSGGAGSAGTSPAAGSGGAPASALCPGLFCEDFEEGKLDTSVWTRTQLSTGNSAAIASDRVAHGQYAMHFHAQGGSRYSMILHEDLPEPLRKHYFGRLYYYASGFPTESGGHTAYITSSNTLDGFPDQDHHLEVASYYESSGPTWQMTYWTGDGPEYIASGGMIPVAKWFCLEWEFDDEPDAIAIWVDGDASRGASFRDIHNGASGLLGSMTTLGLGFRTWHPMGAQDIDVYIDDVVLDTKRVGCLP